MAKRDDVLVQQGEAPRLVRDLLCQADRVPVVRERRPAPRLDGPNGLAVASGFDGYVRILGSGGGSTEGRVVPETVESLPNPRG